MSSAPRDQTGPGCAWAAGVFLGALAAIGVLELGYVGLTVAAAALALIVWKGPRQSGLGGFLCGAGGTLAYLWGSVLISCASRNAESPGSCDAGTLWPWVVGAIAVVIVGAALGVASARRARRSPEDGA